MKRKMLIAAAALAGLALAACEPNTFSPMEKDAHGRYVNTYKTQYGEQEAPGSQRGSGGTGERNWGLLVR